MSDSGLPWRVLTVSEAVVKDPPLASDSVVVAGQSAMDDMATLDPFSEQGIA